MSRHLDEKPSADGQKQYANRYRAILPAPVERLSPFPDFKFWGYGTKTLSESVRYAIKNSGKFPPWFKPLVFGIGTNAHTDYKNANFSNRLQSHDYVEIFYVLRGGLRLTSQNEEFLQHEGDLFIIPPFTPHTISDWLSDDTAFIQLDFSRRLFGSAPGEGISGCYAFSDFVRPVLNSVKQSSPLISLSPEEREKVKAILLDLIEEYSFGTTFSNIYVRIKIIELFYFLFKKINITSFARADNIMRVLRYTMDNYMEDISREDAASNIFMSANTIYHLMKKSTGLNFSQMINYLKVHDAQRRLLTTNNSLSSICHNSGFCDAAYFNNIFKKHTGVTPNAFRKKFRV